MRSDLPKNFDRQKNFHVLTKSFFEEWANKQPATNPFIEAPLYSNELMYNVVGVIRLSEAESEHGVREVTAYLPRMYANRAEQFKYFFDPTVADIEGLFMNQLRVNGNPKEDIALLFFLYNYTRFITAQFVKHQENLRKPLKDRSNLFLQEVRKMRTVEEDNDTIRRKNLELMRKLPEHISVEHFYCVHYMYFPTLCDILNYLHESYFTAHPEFTSEFRAVIANKNLVLPKYLRVLKLADNKCLYVDEAKLNEYYRVILWLNTDIVNQKRYCKYY